MQARHPCYLQGESAPVTRNACEVRGEGAGPAVNARPANQGHTSSE